MAIKAIIFDCFGVLVLPGRSLWYQNYPQLSSGINDLEHQVDYGIINQNQFYNLMSDLVGLEPKKLKSEYQDKRVRNEPMIDLVRELKLSGKYKIGMLSNAGHGFLGTFFLSNEKLDLFNEIILSGDVGIAKPEIAIFELIADRLGLDPSECLMVDDISLNVEAAQNAGMQGLLYVTNSQTKSDLNKLLNSNNA